MAELFGVDRTLITKHLKNIFDSSELQQNDIYATAIDYNKSAPTTRLFYKKVQNKMHYVVYGHTAAELIVERVDASKEHMGLTTWENAPEGKIVKPDVSIAKNYLKQTELEDMGRLVNAVLDNAGRITAEFAKQFAEAEFEKYRVIQDKNFISDFDRFIGDTLLPLDFAPEDECPPNHKERATTFRGNLPDVVLLIIGVR